MTTRFLAAIGLSTLALPLGAVEPRIDPPNPVAYERIALRQTVDSCVFNDDTVQVRLEGRTFLVTQRSNQCLVPGPPEVVDIQLGAVPAGSYRVELREDGATQPVGQLDFTVSSPVTIAIDPPPPRPLANYTGLWWNGVDAGWGISLQQGATNALFGSLLVLDAAGAPRWYSLQAGTWQTSTRWSGRVYRSASAGGAVTHADVGTAQFEFAMTPGREGIGVLTLTIDGTTTTRNIVRLRL
jgi:hypothetical protein